MAIHNFQFKHLIGSIPLARMRINQLMQWLILEQLLYFVMLLL